MTKYELHITSECKQNLKLCKKRGLPMQELWDVVAKLLRGEKLDEKYLVHQLIKLDTLCPAQMCILPFRNITSAMVAGVRSCGAQASRLRSSMSTCQMSSMVESSTRSLVEWGSTMRGPMLAIWIPG